MVDRVVAQIVEQLLPTPEIHGSNPVIGNICLLSTVLKRRNKESGNVYLPIPYWTVPPLCSTCSKYLFIYKPIKHTEGKYCWIRLKSQAQMQRVKSSNIYKLTLDCFVLSLQLAWVKSKHFRMIILMGGGIKNKYKIAQCLRANALPTE